jgi:hypothetical protein
MIEFREKFFAEADAMRQLWVEIQRTQRQTGGYPRIEVVRDPGQLFGILHGNSVVIERFTLSRGFFGKDKYRMFLKMGSRVKLPDNVLLPSVTRTNKVASLSFNYGNKLFPTHKDFSDTQEGPGVKLFHNKDDKNNGNNGRNNGGGGGGNPKKKDKNNNGGFPVQMEVGTNVKTEPTYITYDTKEIKGDVVKYDKKERSLVLEFNTIRDAIESLDILPFGLDYKVYLLDA